VEWFEHAEGASDVASFYRSLQKASLSPRQALVQLGWGSGWDGKTFWSHLQSDPVLFEQIVQDFRMHKGERVSPPRKPGDDFPRSKRVVMAVKNGISHAVRPFGWALLEINPK
jgi:CRISPR-associated protein Csm5